MKSLINELRLAETAYRAEKMNATADLLAKAAATLQIAYSALDQCAGPFDSGPCTVNQGAMFLAAEFKRRMNIAADAMTPTASGSAG